MCEMSMSTGAPAASVSLAAFMLSMNGQIAAAAPTPVTAAAAIVKKSRRVAESEVCAPIGFGCAVSAIAHLSLQPEPPRASRGKPPSARARGAGYRRRGTYTFERLRLCDILPHRRLLQPGIAGDCARRRLPNRALPRFPRSDAPRPLRT